MTTTVGFEDLKINCIIGIDQSERENLQNIYVSLWIEYDATKAVKSENIEHAINYATIAKEVADIAVQKQFLLIETFVDFCLERISTSYPHAEKISFLVKKPDALPDSKYCFCKREVTLRG